MRYSRSALKEAGLQKRINNLAADAGYDGEGNHVHARATYDIRTIILPTIGRKSAALPRTKYRTSRPLPALAPTSDLQDRWSTLAAEIRRYGIEVAAE